MQTIQKLRIRLATVPLVGIIILACFSSTTAMALTILRINRTCIFKAFVGLEASQDFYMLPATPRRARYLLVLRSF